MSNDFKILPTVNTVAVSLVTHDHAAAYVALTDYVAADVLAKLLTVDGTGTGLDADLLDGSHAAAFALLTGATFTGAIIATNNLAAQASFYGWEEVGGAQVYHGQILVGSVAAYQGRFHYLGTTGVLYIDNSYNNDAGNIRFRTKTAGTPVDAMTISGAGNVGIGVAPVYPLDVKTGGINVAGGADGAVLLRFDTDRDWHFRQGGIGSVTRLQLKSEYDGKAFDIVDSAGTTVVTFNVSTTAPSTLFYGNVGIGTTAPQGRLHVHDGTGGFGFFTKTAIGTTAQVIIPDGTGDVAHRITLTALMTDGTNQNGAAGYSLLPSSVLNIIVGSETYEIRCNTNGSVDVRRIIGTLAGTLVMQATWL